MTEQRHIDGKKWATNAVRCRKCGGYSTLKSDWQRESYRQCMNKKTCGITWQERWRREPLPEAGSP